MRIIQLVTSRQYRGAEVFAAELSEQLGRRGHEITFTGLYKPNKNILNAANSINIDLNGKRTVLNLFVLVRFLKLIKSKQPQIIQANGSDTLKYAVLSKFFFPKIKIVYRNISIVSVWAGNNKLKLAVNRFLFSKVDRVTSVGEKAAADLSSTYNYPKASTKVINRGIPCFAFDAVQARTKILQEFSINEAEILLLHAGNFSPEKNHKFLIDSFEQILKQFPTAKLIFLGEGSLYTEVKELVSVKKLSSSIFLPGLKKNMQEYAAGCDLFLMGSIIEGVPGVIMEAAMQGIATVAVNVGGVGEVVLHNQSGILVSKHNVQEFAGTVCSLLEQPELRMQMGAFARQFVKVKYSVETCTENFEKLYTEMITDEN